jgi:glycosyltransferase involved in cell wall biosynthesis
VARSQSGEIADWVTTVKTRKKLLLLIPDMGEGGAERFFAVFLRHFERGLFEPHLAVFKRQGEFLKDIPNDVEVHELGVRRARYALPAIIRVVHKVHPDIILSTLGNANVALMMTRPWLPRSTRIVLSEANSPTPCLQPGSHAALWKWLYRKFYKRADVVVCLSGPIVDEMADHFEVPRAKLRCIYNPLDIQQVCAMAAVGKSPYCGSGPHLVAAGRLCRQKGFDILLAAMPAILRELPGTTLTVLGDGPLRAELRRQAIQLGVAASVFWAGFQENPFPYFRHADAFVLSSRYEGLPYVLLEALAAGAPRVVATECFHLVRKLELNCKCMLVIPGEDPAAFSAGIVAALRNPADCGERPDLTDFALERIIDQYTAELLGDDSHVPRSRATKCSSP